MSGRTRKCSAQGMRLHPYWENTPGRRRGAVMVLRCGPWVITGLLGATFAACVVAWPGDAPASAPTSAPVTSSAPSTQSVVPTEDPTTQSPTSTATRAEEPQEDAYYDSCAEARAAGAVPLRTTEPGYHLGLDEDGDGTACES